MWRGADGERVGRKNLEVDGSKPSAAVIFFFN